MHTERIKRGIALAVGCVAILALGLFPWQRQVQPEPDYVHFVFGQLKYLQPKGSVPGMRMTRPAGWKVRYDRKFPDRAAELLDERGIPWIDLHLGAGQPPNTEEPLAVVVSPYDQVKVFRSESFDQTDRRQEVQYRLFFGIHGLTITIHADDEETLKPVILEMAKTIDYIGP